MTASELMQALADAGAPMEAIIIAVRALESKDAEINARDNAAAAKRAEHAAWKKANREGKRVSMDSPRTRRGQSVDTSPEVSPNDIYSNPLPNPSSTGADAPRPTIYEKVVEAWNDGPAKAGATPAKPLDDGRRKALNVRLREHSEAEVFEAIANLGRSPWHCGKGEKGWKANIGWILKSGENFQKALEMDGGGASEANPPSDFAAHLAAKYRDAA